MFASRLVARVLAVGFPIAVPAHLVLAEPIRCPDVKDVWISTLPEEADCSMGKTDRIKLKVLQELGLIAFDVSALKCRQIQSAELYIHPAGSEQKALVPHRATNLHNLNTHGKLCASIGSGSFMPHPHAPIRPRPARIGRQLGCPA